MLRTAHSSRGPAGRGLHMRCLPPSEHEAAQHPEILRGFMQLILLTPGSVPALSHSSGMK